MIVCGLLFTACDPEKTKEAVEELVGSAKVTVVDNTSGDSTQYSFSNNVATSYTLKNMTVSVSKKDSLMLATSFNGFTSGNYNINVDPANLLSFIGLGSIDSVSGQCMIVLSNGISGDDMFIAYKGSIHVSEYGATGEPVAGTFTASALRKSQAEGLSSQALEALLSGSAPYTLTGSFKGRLVKAGI